MCQGNHCNYSGKAAWNCYEAPYFHYTRGEPDWYKTLSEEDRKTMAVRCVIAVHDKTYKVAIVGGHGTLTICGESYKGNDGPIVSREKILSYLPEGRTLG